MGVNVKNLVMTSYFLGGAIGALGGMVIAPISFMVYDEGTMIGLKGLQALCWEGWELSGRCRGRTGSGLLESLSTGYISSIFKDILAFLVLLSILVIKPTGLMRRAEE
jgi:branched-chain amino acid transport system permease protein